MTSDTKKKKGKAHWSQSAQLVRPGSVVKTYVGTPEKTQSAFLRDAEKMALKGYYPVSQSYVEGARSEFAEVFARVLCTMLIGFLILAYFILVKPPGTLTVTYELRAEQSLSDAGCSTLEPG